MGSNVLYLLKMKEDEPDTPVQWYVVENKSTIKNVK